MNKKFMNQPLSRPLTPREKGIRTKYGTLFIFAALCAITLGVLYSNQEIQFKSLIKENEFRIQKIDSLEKISLSLQNINDSLYSEVFPCQVELTRYQYAYEIFLRRNRKAAEQYGTIISQETE